jgi:hypothetical protein
MTKSHTHTQAQMPRGSFSDGQASPDRYPDDREVGSFAEGEADPARYPGDERVGTFARGSARPATYPADLYEGTFAEEAGWPQVRAPGRATLRDRLLRLCRFEPGDQLVELNRIGGQVPGGHRDLLR